MILVWNILYSRLDGSVYIQNYLLVCCAENLKGMQTRVSEFTGLDYWYGLLDCLNLTTKINTLLPLKILEVK